MGGYKFCISIDTTFIQLSDNHQQFKKYNGASLNIMEGDYDDVLQWPVTLTVTLELINHKDCGQNKRLQLVKNHLPPHASSLEPLFGRPPGASGFQFGGRTQRSGELQLGVRAQQFQSDFLKDDNLHFQITRLDTTTFPDIAGNSRLRKFRISYT